MKFDPSTISQAKRDQWAKVEQDCLRQWSGLNLSVALHNGKRLLWFFGGEIYVDGFVFAECYGMPLDAPQAVIVARVEKLLGKVRVVFDAELPAAAP